MIARQHAEYVFEAALAADSLFTRFRALNVCADLEEQECMMLFACFEVKHVSAGDLLYAANDLSDYTMRLILEGEVSTFYPDSKVYGKLFAGDVFGLFSFLNKERPHAATLQALSDLTVLSLNREYFNVITLEDPELGQHMLRFMFHLLAQQSLKQENEYVTSISGMSLQEVSDA